MNDDKRPQYLRETSLKLMITEFCLNKKFIVHVASDHNDIDIFYWMAYCKKQKQKNNYG